MTLSRRAALLAALAAPTLAPTLAWAADPQAMAPIQALNQALLAAMRSGSAPFAQRYAALAPVVDAAFDLPGILRSSVGLRWNAIAAADQQRLLDVFRKFTIASYVANFDKFGGERIEVVPSTRMLGEDQVVSTRIMSGSDSTPIDYVMHRTPQGWRATDVLLNGSISQVAVNRSDWSALLRSGADSLISSLSRRVATLSNGAIQ